MSAPHALQSSFFRDGQRPATEIDSERFLTEVDARFDSPKLLEELRWRLDVLHALKQQRELDEEFKLLRDQLSRIFALNDDADTILSEVQGLTVIEVEGRKPVDLRYFLQRERHLYAAPEYRDKLALKVENTKFQCENLVTCYPDMADAMRRLRKLMDGLGDKLRSSKVSARTLKRIEDNIRETQPFVLYEDLKERMLRDWLARFAGIPESQLAELGPDEVARLIQEHQRHRITQLATAGVITVTDIDVTPYLGIHDTLEGAFREEGFWDIANAAAKRGFNEWVLKVVQAMALVDGRRYAMFQSQADPESYLLFGLGLPELPDAGADPIRLVPYLKPFTRKSGYLLEVRRRVLGDDAAYYGELRHYTLPFLFGFGRVPELEVPRALRDFFNRAY